jgi:hypothetical protein
MAYSIMIYQNEDLQATIDLTEKQLQQVTELLNEIGVF